MTMTISKDTNRTNRIFKDEGAWQNGKLNIRFKCWPYRFNFKTKKRPNNHRVMDDGQEDN